MVRSLFSIAAFVAIAFFATTVPLGRHTLWGHLSRIWRADETQDLIEEVKDKSQPVVETVKRGVAAGYDEMTRDRDGGAEESSGDGGKSIPGSDAADAEELHRDAAATPHDVEDEGPLSEVVKGHVADAAGEIADDIVRKKVRESLDAKEGVRPQSRR